jgi:hypothetical protein
MALIDKVSKEDLKVMAKLLQKKGKVGNGAKLKELADKYGFNKWYAYQNKDKIIQRAEDSYTEEPSASTVFQTSTLLDAQGNVKLQWVKEKVLDKMAAFQEAVDEVVGKIPEKVNIPKLKSNEMLADDCMTVYTIGDAHIGMMSWHRETGEDHDLEMAENDLKTGMNLLVDQAMATEECMIVDVGDYFHSDNSENKTARGGNSLDVDGRYAKVLEVGLRIATELIDLALQKHQVVRWRSAIGNHNEHSAIMLNAFVASFYRNTDRVIVHDTPSMFMYHSFGKNLIGVTHGHTAKMKDLGEIMSVDCENLWSDSKYRYFYTGHIHHDRRMELRGCTVESFRTLAPKDAWHSSMGYRSGQDMKAITLHKEYGEISRNTVNIGMIYSKQGKKDG